MIAPCMPNISLTRSFARTIRPRGEREQPFAEGRRDLLHRRALLLRPGSLAHERDAQLLDRAGEVIELAVVFAVVNRVLEVARAVVERVEIARPPQRPGKDAAPRQHEGGEDADAEDRRSRLGDAGAMQQKTERPRHCRRDADRENQEGAQRMHSAVSWRAANGS